MKLTGREEVVLKWMTAATYYSPRAYAHLSKMAKAMLRELDGVQIKDAKRPKLRGND